MKVLVTGCNGQVGHCLVEQVVNHQVLAVDRDQLDITDPIAVEKTVLEFEPDIIINAAAHTAVDKAEEEEALSFAINRDGPKYLAESAERIGAAMLHISTDYVFSGDKAGLYNEQDEVNPQGVYGLSKLAGEEAVAKACSRHIILRTAWVFGEHGNNFVKTILRLAQSRDSLGIMGDQFGGPTYAGDIAHTLILIAENIVQQDEEFDSSKFGIYHFSGLPHVSWSDFAQTIFDEAIKQDLLKQSPIITSITTADYPTPAKRPANSKLDVNKINLNFSLVASDWQYALRNLNDYL